MATSRTAAQRAASRANLVKARRARTQAGSAKTKSNKKAYSKNWDKMSPRQQLVERRRGGASADVQRAVQGWGLPYGKTAKGEVRRKLKVLGLKVGGSDIPLGGSKESNKASLSIWNTHQTRTVNRVALKAKRAKRKAGRTRYDDNTRRTAILKGTYKPLAKRRSGVNRRKRK